jgi:pilus assembly protein CpaE
MPTTNPTASILLVSKDPALSDATRIALAEEPQLQLLDQPVTTGNLFSLIAGEKPDVILLDFQFQPQPLNLVDKIATEYPGSAVVAVLTETEMVNSDRVVLSGARAFIQYPYPPGKLVITTKRVLELKGRDQVRPSGPTPKPDQQLKNTFTVFSPKGGAGTTTVAVNFAISLHKALKEEVLLVDGKHLFGHVALYLNLRTGNSIADLIAHAGMLDQRLINQVVVKHTSGIKVLPSPNQITQAQGIRPENLFKIVQALQKVYPYIVIDGGNHLDENTVTYLDSSDKVLLVLNPDLASMRDVRLYMEISNSLSYPKDKTLLLVNLAGRKADVKQQEIEKILKMIVFGTIPADDDLALASLNEGVPILLKKPRHRISRAYTKITKDLVKIIQAAGTD